MNLYAEKWNLWIADTEEKFNELKKISNISSDATFNNEYPFIILAFTPVLKFPMYVIWFHIFKAFGASRICLMNSIYEIIVDSGLSA